LNAIPQLGLPATTMIKKLDEWMSVFIFPEAQYDPGLRALSRLGCPSPVEASGKIYDSI
jgi:hypothetical protein